MLYRPCYIACPVGPGVKHHRHPSGLLTLMLNRGRHSQWQELKAKGPSLSQRPTWPKRLERLNDPNRRSVQEGRAPRFVYQESSWQGVIFRPVRKRNTIPRIKAKRGVRAAATS